METCFKGARELVALFEYAFAGNWAKVEETRAIIVAFEQEADDLTNPLRGPIPKPLFMPVPREDLLNLLWAQDQIANIARDISGHVLGRKMTIPEPLRDDFLAYVSRNVDAAKKARKSIRELDELYTTGFRGAEAAFVEKLVDELDQIENDTDEMQARLRSDLFAIEDDLPPVQVMFLYRTIELVGQVGDMSERIGRRLELLLSH